MCGNCVAPARAAAGSVLPHPVQPVTIAVSHRLALAHNPLVSLSKVTGVGAMVAAPASVLPGHFVAWRGEQSARGFPIVS